MQSDRPEFLRERCARAQQEMDFLTVTEIVERVLSGAGKNATKSTRDVEGGGIFTSDAGAISA